MSELNLTQVDRITSRLEKGYIDNLTAAYKDSLKNIQNQVAEVYRKYSEDGKLTQEDMSKFNRLQKLEKTINEELSHLNRGRPQQLDAYLREVYEANFTGTGGAINTLTDSAINFDVINRDAVVKAITRPMNRIALQTNADAVRLNIKRAITQGVVQGQSIKDMSNNIQSALETNLNNAVRIARTETTGVMGNARQDAFTLASENGIKFKKRWVSTNDGRTRTFEKTNGKADHTILDGQTRNMDEPFSNGLMYPGDQSGEASEVINCRCTMVAEFSD